MSGQDRHVSTGLLPAQRTTQARVDEAYALFRDVADGTVSRVYPALSAADPGHFGLSLVATSGAVASAGDAQVPFAIMSVAKPFVFALACEIHVTMTAQCTSSAPVSWSRRRRTSPTFAPSGVW